MAGRAATPQGRTLSNIKKKKTKKKTKKNVTQSRTGLQIYEGRDDQLNRPGPMA
jgi:hypothetical protein